MKFGRIPLSEAEGSFLAHSLNAGGEKIKKGTLLGPDEISRIKAAGITDVIVARVADGDVNEDNAAARLAGLVANDTVRLGIAATGRVNIYAELDGLFVVDKSSVDAINAVDPSITIATLAAFAPVSRGQMVATVKIIPFAVPKNRIRKVEQLIETESKSVLRVAPWAAKRVGLISTTLPSLKPEIIDKTTRVLQGRLMPTGATIVREMRVAHDDMAVADAIQAMSDDALDLIIVFGASAVVDAQDVIPQGIRLSGGNVIQVGMPVDPGNLLVLGNHGAVPVIGAPGCARSPKENGFDWVLQRVIAGIEISAQDFSQMGVGGLLMEIETRPRPREVSALKRELQVCGLLLAAGSSSRMGGPHKLRALFDGVPLIARAVGVLSSGLSHAPIVVLGHDADGMLKLLAGTDAQTVINPDYAEGLSTSLRLGIGAVPSSSDGVLIHLADMPALTVADMSKLNDSFLKAGGAAIVRATHGGKRGNPVILPRSVFHQVAKLTGDMGARAIIESFGGIIIDVELGLAASLDVDTPEAVIAAGGTII